MLLSLVNRGQLGGPITHVSLWAAGPGPHLCRAVVTPSGPGWLSRGPALTDTSSEKGWRNLDPGDSGDLGLPGEARAPWPSLRT